MNQKCPICGKTVSAYKYNRGWYYGIHKNTTEICASSYHDTKIIKRDFPPSSLKNKEVLDKDKKQE